VNIVHILPDNNSVCGGVKVHYQLAELERALQHTSYVAFRRKDLFPRWFLHRVDLERTYTDIITEITDWENTIVVGWEDLSTLHEFPSKYKVSYVQGESLFNRQANTEGIKFWFSSKWNMSHLPELQGSLIEPYIDNNRFYAAVKSPTNKRLRILVLQRKNGVARWREVAKYLSDDIQSQIKVEFLSDCHEVIYASRLRKADVFFNHSFPEGLGLPALEAMLSGAIVIGYSGGGGTDFMVNEKNCFYADDGDAEGVAIHLKRVIELSKNEKYSYKSQEIIDMGFSAEGTARSYEPYKTKMQLKESIQKIIEG